MEVFNSDFLFAMNVFQDNKVLLSSSVNVTFYTECMVSEIMVFYCQPDMTSSSVPRQGHCTHFIMTDSERATMTSWYRSVVTVYLKYMVSEITRFYCKPDVMSS